MIDEDEIKLSLYLFRDLAKILFVVLGHHNHPHPGAMGRQNLLFYPTDR